MKLGRSYTVDVILPDTPGGALMQEEIPAGFELLVNGRGAVRITARDRDRFGELATPNHLMAVLCDNADDGVIAVGDSTTVVVPLSNAEWQERFRHGR